MIYFLFHSFFFLIPQFIPLYNQPSNDIKMKDMDNDRAEPVLCLRCNTAITAITNPETQLMILMQAHDYVNKTSGTV